MSDRDRWQTMTAEERDAAKQSAFGTYWSEVERQARRSTEEEA